MKSFLKEDINQIIDYTKNQSHILSGKNILLTGGNGFLGKYFIEVFKEYNKLYAEYFNGPLPTRTTVDVRALPTPIAIELKVVATI